MGSLGELSTLQKLKNVFGFRAKVKLEGRLMKTVYWYQGNMASVWWW